LGAGVAAAGFCGLGFGGAAAFVEGGRDFDVLAVRFGGAVGFVVAAFVVDLVARDAGVV
jgi:hypothetical protein